MLLWTARTNVRRAEVNMNRTLAEFCVAVAIGACSAQPPAASGVSPAVSLSAASPTASPAPSGWPTGDPAPPELAGRWYQASGAIIVLSGHDYTFPGAGGGNFVVNGNEITFFNGFNCGEPLPGGIGRYTWTVTGGTLNFVQLVDPCSRIDGTWTRTKS